jgi:hypothetical protein
MEVGLTGGGRLVVEVDPADVPSGDVELASAEPGRVVARAAETLEQSLDALQPALTAMLDRLRASAPAELAVQFGLKVGGEAGLIVAKGTAEVNFVFTLTWKHQEDA